MQKCGLVMKDPDSGKMKIKLYTEKGSDVLKGDALCTYIKVSELSFFSFYVMKDKSIVITTFFFIIVFEV